MAHSKTTLFTTMIFTACSTIAASCTPASTPLPPTSVTTPTSPPISVEQPTATPQDTPPPALPPPVSMESSPAPIPFQICSPLADISNADLDSHISNPFHPPQPGSDAPHQGIDLADYYGDNRIAIEGRTVNAVLDGRVAAVINDRFPYGYAVMIETPFEMLPSDWKNTLSFPTSPPEGYSNPTLTCPPIAETTSGMQEITSLYLLYAHLQAAPAAEVGDLIQCGQPLGIVGSSGNALNPHLHLETRTGPGDAQFGSMAHYDPTASEDEMGAYCTWRVSGLFPLFDPMTLFPPQT
jgi:murein DD-endopeptidase MepM/ murein hydrolase activator NlpD